MTRPCLENNEAFAYFYCSRTTNDTSQRDPRAILLSILRQLVSPSPDLPLKPPILSVYQREEARGSQEAQLSIEEITALIKDLVQNHYARITLIIDALDECDIGKRAQLLDIITKLTYNPRSVVKTLVSSRNDSDIEYHFSRIENRWITEADNAADIKMFVKTELSKRLLSGKASHHLRERVEKELTKKADGVFRWVTLQVDALCDPECAYSERDIEYLLPRLPKTLEQTYAEIMDRIDRLLPPSREAFTNVIKLLMCAASPMSVGQVLEALAILSESHKVEWDETTILSMGRGLIISEDHRLWSSHRRSHFAFAHLSVREFFESRPDFNGEPAHAIAAEACLKFFLRFDRKYVEYSDFRQYASDYLGQHCAMSGKKRQESRLQDLMQEFLLPRDSNVAFARWQDSYGTFLSPYKELGVLSPSGLPLFMICVYGFDEFVDPAIEQSKSALFAENLHQHRPLEAAARAGNLVTMRLVYNAASSGNRSPIRAEKWLVAAAESDNLNIWNFVLEHIQDVPVQIAVIKAAQAQKNGKEMVYSLLEDPNDIDEEMLIEILPCCASFDTLDLILPKSYMPRFTERMLEAAVLNPTLNPALVKRVLTEGQKLRVSATSILMAFQSSSKNKASVMEALLNQNPRCEISEEVVYNAVRHSIDTDIALLSLLLEHCSMGQITEDCLIASATNPSNANNAFQLCLERSRSPMISQQVLQSTFTECYSRTRRKSFLSQPDCPSLPDETLYRYWPMDLSEAMLLGRPVYITDKLLQACAAKTSPLDMRMVISLPRAIPISREVLRASLKNVNYPADVLDLLLQHRTSFDLEPSEDLLFAALSLHNHALETIIFLANHWTTLPITEALMVASVERRTDATQIFEYLITHCESVEIGLTDNVLLGAIRAGNLGYMEYYKQQRPNFEVQEEYLIAAANARSPNLAVVRILLSQLGNSPISDTIVETAARAGNQSMVELILDKSGARHLTPYISDLAEATPPQIETDEDVTFESILSTIEAEEAEEDDYLRYDLCWRLHDGRFVPSYASVIHAFELSTTKIDRLLMKYNGSKLDSSLLLEAAANRKDGKFVVQFLLSRFPDTVVTQGALLAAASNEKALTTLLEFLLDFSHEKVDMELLREAAANKYRGTPIIELLLARLPTDIKIERYVTAAALKNPYCGRSILELLLKREPSLEVTQDLVDAAFENSVQGNFLLHTLLKHSLTLCSSTSADLILRKMRSTENGLLDYLFIAACYGNASVLQHLVSEGATVHAVSGELGTPLNVAARAGNLDAVNILLDSGSDREACSLVYGTPLQTACRQRNLAMIQTLVKYGAEIDRGDQIGRTVLQTALKEGEYDLVCLLLSLGASATKRDYQGMAAMHHTSICTKSAELISKLIESGTPVDQEDSQKWTPLHWAAKSGSTHFVNGLLRAGFSKNKVDASGKTPFQIATFCGSHHLRSQLFVETGTGSNMEAVGKRHKDIYCDICEMVSCKATVHNSEILYTGL